MLYLRCVAIIPINTSVNRFGKIRLEYRFLFQVLEQSNVGSYANISVSVSSRASLFPARPASLTKYVHLFTYPPPGDIAVDTTNIIHPLFCTLYIVYHLYIMKSGIYLHIGREMLLKWLMVSLV